MRRPGNKDASKKLILDALKTNKNELSLYRFLASLYEKEKKYPEAIQTLKQALAVNPNDEEILF